MLQISVKPFSYSVIIIALVMLLLLFGSAFFSASENAFFSLGPADNDELENDDSSTSNLIKELLEKPKKLLATILIGNNIVNVGIAVLSTIFIEQTFEFHSETVKLVIQVIAVTFIILLVGEVMPKVYATQNPLTTARFFAYPLYIIGRFFYP
ncbi:MAG: DUF21 domain-containing protein [Sphingobacteriales bacterium JAD_PAG50586_3]|nr:MAG: DUF21 domain-containing protein [Sphingobacteriales bacterium JAD_PAG50586_3]